MSSKFKFQYNQTRLKVTQFEDRNTFSFISRSVFSQNVKSLDIKVVQESKTHFFLFRNGFSPPKIMRYCRAGQVTDDNITGRMRVACCLPMASNSEYLILIASFFLNATMVTRTRLNITLYVHCLLLFKFPMYQSSASFGC